MAVLLLRHFRRGLMSNLISLVPDTFSPLPQRNRPSTAPEPVGLYVHALQHGHEKVGERGVVFLVEGDVTSVFETAAGEDDVEVCGFV